MRGISKAAFCIICTVAWWATRIPSLFATEPHALPPPLHAPFEGSIAQQRQREFSEKLRHDVVEKGAAGISMTLIPPGEFMMGRSEGLDQLKKLAPGLQQKLETDSTGIKEALASEQPQHRVRISKAFYIGTYSVTRAQFRSFVEQSGYQTDAERDGLGGTGFLRGAPQLLDQKPDFDWRNTGFVQADDHPVVNVSWNDAVEFCGWLCKREGVKYRLPTEAEWEYACRAGSIARYYSGDDPESLAKFANVADGTFTEKLLDPAAASRWVKSGSAIEGKDGFVFTSPVGRFKPNAFGIHDMHGNVGNWCADGFEDDFYSKSPIDDPVGNPKSEYRIARGGSWANGPIGCRAASRNSLEPTFRSCLGGFRVVREIGK